MVYLHRRPNSPSSPLTSSPPSLLRSLSLIFFYKSSTSHPLEWVRWDGHNPAPARLRPLLCFRGPLSSLGKALPIFCALSFFLNLLWSSFLYHSLICLISAVSCTQRSLLVIGFELLLPMADGRGISQEDCTLCQVSVQGLDGISSWVTITRCVLGLLVLENISSSLLSSRHHFSIGSFERCSMSSSTTMTIIGRVWLVVQ